MDDDPPAEDRDVQLPPAPSSGSSEFQQPDHVEDTTPGTIEATANDDGPPFQPRREARGMTPTHGSTLRAVGAMLTLFGVSWAVYTGLVTVEDARWSENNDALQSCAALYSLSIFSTYSNSTLEAGVLPPAVGRRAVLSVLPVRPYGLSSVEWSFAITATVVLGLAAGLGGLMYTRPRMQRFSPADSWARTSPNFVIQTPGSRIDEVLVVEMPIKSILRKTGRSRTGYIPARYQRSRASEYMKPGILGSKELDNSLRVQHNSTQAEVGRLLLDEDEPLPKVRRLETAVPPIDGILLVSSMPIGAVSELGGEDEDVVPIDLDTADTEEDEEEDEDSIFHLPSSLTNALDTPETDKPILLDFPIAGRNPTPWTSTDGPVRTLTYGVRTADLWRQEKAQAGGSEPRKSWAVRRHVFRQA